MSLWEEVGEEQIGRHLGCTTTQQIQLSHSAVEGLLSQLEAVRSSDGTVSIDRQISRMEGLLEGKQGLAGNDEAQDESWLCQRLLFDQSTSPLLIEMVKKERNFMEDTIRRALRGVFLSEQSAQQERAENESIGETLSVLRLLRDQLTHQKNPSRQQLRQVDQQLSFHQQTIRRVQSGIKRVDLQLSRILNGMHQFQQIICEQFRNHITMVSQSETNPTVSALPPTPTSYSQPTQPALSRPPQPLLSQPPLDLTYQPPQHQEQHSHSYMKTTSNFGPRRSLRSGFNPMKTEGWGQKTSQQQISELGVNSRLNIGGEGRRVKVGGWKGGFR